jgi:callose synthase
LLFATLSGFLTYVFLEPLFVPVGLELANVALWVLAIFSSMVGMSLGVLLPTLCPGLCFGATLALLVGCFIEISEYLYFPVVGGVAALVGALLSVR